MPRPARHPHRRAFGKNLPFRPVVELLEDRLTPAVFNVLNDLNSGAGSLRQAILDSNALVGADEIRFDPGFFATPRTIALTTGELRVRDDLTVTGPGAGLLRVSANNASRVFNVNDGDSYTLRSARIEGLTITGGRTSGGGGIRNAEVLELVDSTVSGNAATYYGGGVFNQGTLTVTGSTVSGNAAGYSGGGVYNSGTLTMTGSTVSGNAASFSGGGVYNRDTLTVTNSTVSGNAVTRSNGYGAGIATRGGTLTVTGSTVSGNTARSGGGISASDSTLTVTNSTVSGNTASTGSGGGISALYGTLTVTNSTVSGNTAGRNGGGIYHEYGTLRVTQSTVSGNAAATGGNLALTHSGATLANSIIADAVSGGDVLRTGAGLLLSGVNLVEDGSVTGPGVINADPKLGPLDDYGGPTKTHLLLPGSPAIDAGDTALALLTPLATDQRGAGFSRVRGAGLDLGSVETQPPPGPVSVAAVTTLAREGDPAANTLVFALHRAGDPADPLDVPAALGGTALPGDYAVSVAGGTRTPTGFRFAAGSAELTVTLTVGDDAEAEPAETVLLTIGPGTGLPADAGVGVIDRDFDTQVTTTADDGRGSLRLALGNAEDRPGADVVTFDPAAFSTPRTITLTSGQLTIRTDVTIAGPGPGLLTVSGNNASRVFNIDDGNFDTDRAVRIEGLTITGGRASDGGGIRNTEGLELVDSTVSGNTAGRDGGGIANVFGTLAVAASTVSGNTAGRDGSGIANRFSVLEVTGSTVSGNTAGRDGGGIANTDAVMTVADSVISGNTAGRDGGGVANDQGTAALVNSTVSGNTAGRAGGGLSNRGYYDYYYGYSYPGRATLSQVTVAGNAAPAGGNLANGELGELTLANSIVADAVSGGDVSRSGDLEELILSGVNLVEDGSVTGPGVINADPKLGALADNGGPTKTHFLLPGSPAFNAASAPIPAGLTTDQRGTGFDRVRGGGLDLGAFEVQSSRITAATDTPSTPEDTVVTLAVLANDTDEYGTPLHVVAVGTPSSGTVVLNPDGTITYTPTPDFNGTATFTYTVVNAFGDSQTGTVEVTVTAVNDAPTVAVPAAQTTAEDVAVTVTGIAVADADAAEGTGWVRVTLSVGFGTLTVPTGAPGGLTGGQITGNGTAWVVLEGPLAAVNATLAAGVTYLGNVNFSGDDALRVVANDLGNTGAGGPLEAEASVPIRVVSAADQIADLRARVVALGAQGVLNGGLTNSLLVKLDQAARKLAGGQVRVAYNLIGAFINEVESLKAGGVLSPDQADWLLIPARRLRQSLLGGGGF